MFVIKNYLIKDKKANVINEYFSSFGETLRAFLHIIRFKRIFRSTMEYNFLPLDDLQGPRLVMIRMFFSKVILTRNFTL